MICHNHSLQTFKCISGLTAIHFGATLLHHPGASFVLNPHRALRKEMIRRLADLLYLPESLLLRPYELVRDAG